MPLFGYELDVVSVGLLLAALAGFVTPIAKMIFDASKEKAKAVADKEQKERDDAEKVRQAVEVAAEKKEQRAREDAQVRAVAEVARKADVAADKVGQVKRTLEEATEEQSGRLDSIQKTGQLTHDLVNSASLVQLKLYAVAARRIADLTKDPADAEAATVAERLYHDHEAKAVLATRKAESRDDKNQSPGGVS